MSFIDSKYIGLVSSRLQKFSQRKIGLYNFRCPYCGDSQKHKNKARGYIYKYKNDHNFKCHNCGMSKSFGKFLQDFDTTLYDQYVMERYKNGLTGKGSNTPNPEFNFEKPNFVQKREDNLKKLDLPSLFELNKGHPARAYVESRKIPQKFLTDLYYCEKFKEWTNRQIHTFNDLDKEESRIIIPLRDKDKNIFGYQGRSLDPRSKLRYITIMLDQTKPKIFGLDKIDETKTVYITEGPFDSTFLCNSIAMCGADVHYDNRGNNNSVYVYDNEPRNREILARIDKTIQQGNKVVIWPSDIKQKDINDMVLSGLDVESVVESNIYSGLEAKLKFTNWKKV